MPPTSIHFHVLLHRFRRKPKAEFRNPCCAGLGPRMGRQRQMATKMQQYSIYLMGPDGRVVERITCLVSTTPMPSNKPNNFP